MKEDKIVISTSHTNPVDFYNKNHVQDCFDFMLTTKNVKAVGIDAFTYSINQSDDTKRMFVIEDNHFVAQVDNALKLVPGVPYTPFQMLQKFGFKNNFYATMFHVMTKYMGHENDYIRVGTKYCKTIHSKDRFNITRTELLAWDKTTIVDDLGKGVLLDIPKYDSFVVEPNNKDYHASIGGRYNMYAEFAHKPLDEEKYNPKGNQWKWIETLLKHIFGEQYEMGLKYFKVLYDHPKQTLPILALVSKENQTGKSTLIDFTSILFGDNTVLANSKTISSQFNSAYASKNIMMIEEALFEKKADAEKIKALATQKTINVNTKNLSEYNSPLFLKIIIASNNSDKFVNIDQEDIRYWVREIPSLKGKGNHNILEDMTKEIPAFLAHLNSMPDVDLSKSRMVFTDEELKTQALEKVKEESRSGLYKDIEIHLNQHCENNDHIEVFYFSEIDIKEQFFSYNSKYEVSYIKKVLTNEFKLEKKKQRYPCSLENRSTLPQGSQQGRVFSYSNPYYNEVQSITPDESDVPF